MSDLTDGMLGQDEEWDGAAPRVSVVITWPRDLAHLPRALTSHLSRRADAALDMIVVTAGVPDGALIGAYPDIRFIPAGDGASLAHMRLLGTTHALGDIVMLIDDVSDDAPVPDYARPQLLP